MRYDGKILFYAFIYCNNYVMPIIKESNKRFRVARANYFVLFRYWFSPLKVKYLLIKLFSTLLRKYCVTFLNIRYTYVFHRIIIIVHYFKYSFIRIKHFTRTNDIGLGRELSNAMYSYVNVLRSLALCKLLPSTSMVLTVPVFIHFSFLLKNKNNKSNNIIEWTCINKHFDKMNPISTNGLHYHIFCFYFDNPLQLYMEELYLPGASKCGFFLHASMFCNLFTSYKHWYVLAILHSPISFNFHCELEGQCNVKALSSPYRVVLICKHEYLLIEYSSYICFK